MHSDKTKYNSVYHLLDLDHIKTLDAYQSTTNFEEKLPYSLIPGTHVVADRIIYKHHGIYVGNNKVIANLQQNGIRVCSWKEFADGNEVSICYHDDETCYSNEDIVKRAYSKIGEDDYLLLTNNCEHFANWCVTGKKYSKQVRVIAIAALSATITKCLCDISRNKSPISTIAVSAGLTTLATSKPVQKFIANAADQTYDNFKDLVTKFTSSNSENPSKDSQHVQKKSNTIKASNDYGIDNAINEASDLLKDTLKRIF